MDRLRALAGSPGGRNSAGSLVIQGSQRLSRIVTIVVAAAALEPAAFAALAIALALTDIIRSGLLAYDVSAVRRLAGGETPSTVLGSHLAAKVVVALTGTIAIVTLAWLVYEPTTVELVLITSVGTIPSGIATLLLVRRQVEFGLGSAAPRVAAGTAFGGGLAIVGAITTHQPVVVCCALSAADLLILALVYDAPGIASTRVRDGLAVIGRTATLLIMQLAYIAQFRVGTVVLGAVGAVVAVGEYTVASRIAEGFVIIAGAITASSLPLMAAAYARRDRANLELTVRRSYRLALVVSAPVVLVLALTAPVWVQLLFPRYPGAAVVYIPVGITVIAYFATSQTTAFLNASHRDRTAVASAVAGVAGASLGSWWLVGAGAIGVAFARLAGELIRLAIETATMARGTASVARSMAADWVSVAPVVAVAGMLLLTGWTTGAVLVGVGVTAAWAAVAVRRARITLGR